MTKEEKASLVVQVRPNARQNEVTGFSDGVLRVRIAAPPLKGKANRELANYLGDILGIAPSRVTIEKGLTGKTKRVTVSGLDRQHRYHLVLNS